jgi:hypothetical protein
LTKGQPYSNENYILVWSLNLMKTWIEILLNLTQIQDYTMTNTWLYGFNGGMLHRPWGQLAGVRKSGSAQAFPVV